ncbi:polyisoprenoid-binding protein [Chryseobacterium shandongense]|uniref:Polyisoprenoid-binding protein n=1 Tax=Chryseobacterium shandongense TaxID=1493872 RepID=A0AAD1DKD6_9FLAO|nr:YceI family protein [Chryseobacterium shandongense]AZA85476.1 polyisoprenoid-binding protein [Chryseobacterium shandongense]AZA97583.1 polyisoprenoid-binding protein [Chryseobacterium shandongense]
MNNWKSDPEHSRLGFKIEHMMISEVNGIFKNFEITIDASDENFNDAVIELIAEIASIDTQVEARDKHLKNEDFFDVENYPVLRFKSNSLIKIDHNKFSVSGILEMHDVSKEVKVLMIYNGTIDNPVTGKRTSGFQITGKISRNDFGIAVKFPEKLIGDEVSITLDAELQLQQNDRENIQTES